MSECPRCADRVSTESAYRARLATMENRALAAEKKVARYAGVLRIFGVFYAACLAHNFKDKRPVLTRRAPMGFLFGLKDRLTLTADDFRMASYVLREHEPASTGDVDEMAAKLTENAIAYGVRHPEQRHPAFVAEVSKRLEVVC